jgi:hypothetical protein
MVSVATSWYMSELYTIANSSCEADLFAKLLHQFSLLLHQIYFNLININRKIRCFENLCEYIILILIRQNTKALKYTVANLEVYSPFHVLTRAIII